MLFLAAVVLVITAFLAGRSTRSWWFVTGPLLVPFAVLIVGADYLPDMADCTQYEGLLHSSKQSSYPSVLWVVAATAGRLWRLRSDGPAQGPHLPTLA